MEGLRGQKGNKGMKAEDLLDRIFSAFRVCLLTGYAYSKIYKALSFAKYFLLVFREEATCSEEHALSQTM